MADNTLLGSRKFYKIRSLNGCFVISKKSIQNETFNVYTGTLTPESVRINLGIENINEDTILFITASITDLTYYIQIPLLYKRVIINGKPKYTVGEYQYKKINRGDTFLWAKGEFYPLSLNEIKDIEEDNGTLNIIYSNGSNKTISLKNISGGYNAIYPIIIDDGNIILDGLYIDGENQNMKTFDNTIGEGIKNSYVEGIGNTSTIDYQHVMGKYAKQDNNSLFIIGGGDDSNNRKNLLTVGFDGITRAENDVIVNNNKLSDIHDVVDEDWVVVNKKEIQE